MLNVRGRQEERCRCYCPCCHGCLRAMLLGREQFTTTIFSGTERSKGKGKRATKNVQLVLQDCCKTSWIAMLRVLPTMFKPVNNLICCKTGLMWVVKRATSLFNSFRSNLAKQVARVLLPVFTYPNIVAKLFLILTTLGPFIRGKIRSVLHRTRLK